MVDASSDPVPCSVPKTGVGHRSRSGILPRPARRRAVTQRQGERPDQLAPETGAQDCSWPGGGPPWEPFTVAASPSLRGRTGRLLPYLGEKTPVVFGGMKPGLSPMSTDAPGP